MTGRRPPFQPKKFLLASISIAVPTATGFLSNTGQIGLIIPLGFLSMAALPFWVIALGDFRPKGERWVAIPALLIFVGSLFPAGIGGHSLWLTAFGETQHCRVESIERHHSSRGSDSFSADLLCGDRKLTFFPTNFREVKPVNTEMDVVTDKTGFFTSIEPDQVSWRYNLFFLAGLLVTAAFMLFVAWLPVRDPELAATEAQSD
ncbi:hypothetical protein [Lentzea sp. E54]|uniref:hypothetical protein n=1 Tax=Lentzea xerophila TaxID=3435883 RepID=UPI003DA22E95